MVCSSLQGVLWKVLKFVLLCEALALKDIFQQVLDEGITYIWAKIDSEVLIQIIDHTCAPWQISHERIFFFLIAN